MKTDPIVPQPPPLLTIILLMIPFVLPLGLALDLYLPSVPSMASALGTNAISIQLTLTVFMYCFGFGQLIVGPITDRFGRHRILLVSIVLFTLGSIICTSADNLSILLTGRIFQAFGACGSQVVAFAMVRDQYDGKNATLIFTSLKGAMAIAPIGAPVLGAFLQIYYGWQANFAVLSLYGLSALLLAFFLKETRLKTIREQQSAQRFFGKYIKPYKAILSNPEFLYFGTCGLATQAAMFGYFSLSPRYFITLHGLSESQFAILFSANAVAFLLTSIVAGKFIYRLGFQKSTLIGALMLICSGIFMIGGDFAFDHYFVLFLPNLIASSSAAIMLGASASGAMMPFKHNAGAAAAMFGCMEFIGGGFVGSTVIRGNNISVIPLTICLMSLGVGLIVANAFLQKRAALPSTSN